MSLLAVRPIFHHWKWYTFVSLLSLLLFPLSLYLSLLLFPPLSLTPLSSLIPIPSLLSISPLSPRTFYYVYLHSLLSLSSLCLKRSTSLSWTLVLHNALYVIIKAGESLRAGHVDIEGHDFPWRRQNYSCDKALFETRCRISTQASAAPFTGTWHTFTRERTAEIKSPNTSD